jgi:hypothetical protein
MWINEAEQAQQWVAKLTAVSTAPFGKREVSPTNSQRSSKSRPRADPGHPDFS